MKESIHWNCLTLACISIVNQVTFTFPSFKIARSTIAAGSIARAQPTFWWDNIIVISYSNKQVSQKNLYFGTPLHGILNYIRIFQKFWNIFPYYCKIHFQDNFWLTKNKVWNLYLILIKGLHWQLSPQKPWRHSQVPWISLHLPFPLQFPSPGHCFTSNKSKNFYFVFVKQVISILHWHVSP